MKIKCKEQSVEIFRNHRAMISVVDSFYNSIILQILVLYVIINRCEYYFLLSMLNNLNQG